jgi:hypothetical protein
MDDNRDKDLQNILDDLNEDKQVETFNRSKIITKYRVFSKPGIFYSSEYSKC